MRSPSSTYIYQVHGESMKDAGIMSGECLVGIQEKCTFAVEKVYLYNMDLIKFLKNWTLPVAMIGGALGYLVCRALPLPYEVKADMLAVTEVLQPVLLFLMR